MKTKNKIAIAALLLCGGLLTGAGYGIMNSKEASAQETTPIFEVQSVSLRIPDATYGEGMRFTIVMDMDTYTNKNVANLMSGVLLIPEYALGEEELTLDLENSALKNVSVTWSESNDGEFMQVYLHVYNVPPMEYTTDLCVRAYVDDGNAETAPIYTDVAISSVAKAADWLYDNDTSLTEEETVALKATYLTYDVFYHNGEDVVESTGVYGEKITAPTAPEKDGYTFDGWWNENKTAQWDFDNMTISGTETNLYAKWNMNTYTAKVVRADGSEETVEFTIENRAEKLSAIALTASDAQYTYSWVSALPTELALNNDQVFTEKRDVNTYTVTFDVDGGSAVEAQTVPYGTPASELANFTSSKADYIFEGWTLENGAEIPADAVVTSDITVKAKWKSAKVGYTVKFYFNTATNAEYVENEQMEISAVGIIDTTATYAASKISGYKVNTEKSTLSGVVAADGSLVLSVYYDVDLIQVATYDQFRTAVTSNLNAYILLTDDIDPLTEKSITEQQWTMVGDASNPFTGVIDGQGYAIKNLTYYDGSDTWNNGFGMFYQFNGTIKNVSLENFKLSKDKGIVASSGVIARIFTGTAENVYVSVKYSRSYWQNNTQQSGGMFGIVKAGSTIKNCVVKMTSNGESKIGYLAGRLDGDATIENFVAVTANNVGLFGCYNTSPSINGTACKSDATAATLIDNYLVDGEAIVVANAYSKLGDAWICDGVNMPALRSLSDAEKNTYVVEVYVGNAADATYAFKLGKKLVTDATTVALSASDLDAMPGYTVDAEKSILTGTITDGSALVLKVYYKFSADVVRVATYDEFRAAVTSNPSAYILLTDDIDPLTEKGITEQQWSMVSTEFKGVIDGQGYAIKNLTYYDGSNTWNNGFAMFSTVSGTIKNISFENFKLTKDYGVVQTCGVIARVFSGKAENVYVSVKYTRSYWQNDTQQSGGMFGCVKAGSIIKNCVVKMTTNGESKIGYLAGRIDGDATIENFVAVTANNVGLFGYYNSGASINGTACKSDATAATLISGLLIDTEQNVIAGAGAILGNAWVCDGTAMPALVKPNA